MRTLLVVFFVALGACRGAATCADLSCATGTSCGFRSTVAECFTRCDADGGCAAGEACGCVGSCPGCENCLMVCVPR